MMQDLFFEVRRIQNHHVSNFILLKITAARNVFGLFFHEVTYLKAEILNETGVLFYTA